MKQRSRPCERLHQAICNCTADVRRRRLDEELHRLARGVTEVDKAVRVYRLKREGRLAWSTFDPPADVGRAA